MAQAIQPTESKCCTTKHSTTILPTAVPTERSAVTVQDYLDKYPASRWCWMFTRDAVQRDTHTGKTHHRN